MRTAWRRIVIYDTLVEVNKGKKICRKLRFMSKTQLFKYQMLQNCLQAYLSFVRIVAKFCQVFSWRV